jgi:hypothetical protein
MGRVLRWILIGQSVPPTPIVMAFGRLKLWARIPGTKFAQVAAKWAQIVAAKWV